ncbi:MAG: hypothetical protein QOI74_813 [Micromonosporaceae bacterium]|nr:hypothetical protein [Micromonosporaceae bacterium]
MRPARVTVAHVRTADTFHALSVELRWGRTPVPGRIVRMEPTEDPGPADGGPGVRAGAVDGAAGIGAGIPAGSVTLREFGPGDVANLTVACNDPLVRRFLPALPSPYTTADAKRFVTGYVGEQWAAGGGVFAVADQDRRRAVRPAPRRTVTIAGIPSTGSPLTGQVARLMTP